MADIDVINQQIDETVTNETGFKALSSVTLGGTLKAIALFVQNLVNSVAGSKVDKTITVNGLPLSGNIALTKAHVGLSSVNNTSDMAKPVSTAQAAAIAAAQLGVVHLAGGYNASVGTYPTTGTGNGGAVRAGDTYRITTPGSIGQLQLSMNDELLALEDNPGQTAAKWFRPPYNSSLATELTVGTSRRASLQEAAEGEEEYAYVTPYTMVKVIDEKLQDFTPDAITLPLEFSAQLYQIGTNAPNPQAPQLDTISNEVYENGQQASGYRAISFSRSDVGTFKLRLWYKTAAGINSSKIAVQFGDATTRITSRANGGNGTMYYTEFEFKTYTPAGVLSDGMLQGNNGTFLNIKIYP
jgi:hypothetical protein